MHVDSSLYNLDLSDNYSNKNEEKIELLNKIIDETNLYCLDLSHILFGPEANNEIVESLKEYKKTVDNLKEKLNEDQKSNERTIDEINYNKVDKEKIEKINNFKDLRNEFSKFDQQISEIIENENSKYPIFLKEKARWLISEIISSDNTMNNIDSRELENYMVWRKSNENLKRLIKKKKEKKLILI